jgi:hypothetical protein
VTKVKLGADAKAALVGPAGAIGPKGDSGRSH